MTKGLGIILTIIGALLMGLLPLGSLFYILPRSFPAWLGMIIGSLVLIIGIVITSSGESESFRPDNKTLKIADHKPCSVCGKEDYTWGLIGGRSASRFRTKMVGTIWSGKPILARTCDNCGHIELFIKRERP